MSIQDIYNLIDIAEEAKEIIRLYRNYGIEMDKLGHRFTRDVEPERDGNEILDQLGLAIHKARKAMG